MYLQAVSNGAAHVGSGKQKFDRGSLWLLYTIVNGVSLAWCAWRVKYKLAVMVFSLHSWPNYSLTGCFF